MSIYQLPKFDSVRNFFKKFKREEKSTEISNGVDRLKLKAPKFWRNKNFWLLVLVIFLASFFGFLGGSISGNYFYLKLKEGLSKFNIQVPERKDILERETIIEKEYIPQTSQEEAIISAYLGSGIRTCK